MATCGDQLTAPESRELQVAGHAEERLRMSKRRRQTSLAQALIWATLIIELVNQVLEFLSKVVNYNDQLQLQISEC
jgi:hypothetical protein